MAYSRQISVGTERVVYLELPENGVMTGMPCRNVQVSSVDAHLKNRIGADYYECIGTRTGQQLGELKAYDQIQGWEMIDTVF